MGGHNINHTPSATNEHGEKTAKKWPDVEQKKKIGATISSKFGILGAGAGKAANTLIWVTWVPGPTSNHHAGECGTW